jgi:hypothetical protein
MVVSMPFNVHRHIFPFRLVGFDVAQKVFSNTGGAMGGTGGPNSMRGGDAGNAPDEKCSTWF